MIPSPGEPGATLYLAQLEETDNDEGESWVKVLGIFPEEASARARVDEEMEAAMEGISSFGCVTGWPLGQGWPSSAWARTSAVGDDGEWHEIPVEESTISWPVAPR